MHSSNKEHSKVIFLFSPTHISKKLDKCLHAAVCYSYRQKYHLSFYWEKHNLSLQQFIFCILYFKVINPGWSSFIIFSIFFFLVSLDAVLGKNLRYCCGPLPTHCGQCSTKATIASTWYCT